MSFKSILKCMVYQSAYWMRYPSKLIKFVKMNNVIPILSLHRISPEQNSVWPPLAPKVFNELLNYLKKNFEIVLFRELNTVNSKKPKLVLSFDDGYYDFIEYAMPILHSHGLKANQNIIPSQLLGELPLWNIALYDFLKVAPFSLIKEIQFLNLNVQHLIQKKMNKMQIALYMSHFLKKLSCQERTDIMKYLTSSIFSKLNNYPQTRMIKIHEMSEVISQHEVGVHSYSHNSMGNEPMEYFICDFEQCKDFFVKYNFPPLTIYAFPNGSYRKEQIDYLYKEGIAHILLVNDEYATSSSPYNRFNIAAFNRYEAILQGLGIKSRWKKRYNHG